MNVICTFCCCNIHRKLFILLASGTKKFIIDPKSLTILARLDRLEYHVSPILEQVLNNDQYLASIKPYLDEILERFDDIEDNI